MKKEKSKQADRMWAFTSDPDVQEILPHFLCPLELAAFDKRFTNFEYDISGRKLRINGAVNRALLFAVKQRVKFYYNILRSARIEEAQLRDPKINKFLCTSPERFDLSNRLKNKLRANKITRMEQIAYIGKDQLAGCYRMGKTSAAQIIALFEKNGCGDLL